VISPESAKPRRAFHKSNCQQAPAPVKAKNNTGQSPQGAFRRHAGAQDQTSPMGSTARKPRSTVLSVRLSQAEWQRLDREAGAVSISAHVRSRLSGDNSSLPGTPSRRVPTQNKLLAQLLAALGRSELGPSLKTLANVAKSGALPVTEEVEAALLCACHDITSMKSTLMRALGIKED